MNLAERAGLTDPKRIEYYENAYRGTRKSDKEIIRAIKNKEASRKKNIEAQEKAERAEWGRLQKLAFKYGPQAPPEQTPYKGGVPPT